MLCAKRATGQSYPHGMFDVVHWESYYPILPAWHVWRGALRELLPNPTRMICLTWCTKRATTQSYLHDMFDMVHKESYYPVLPAWHVWRGAQRELLHSPTRMTCLPYRGSMLAIHLNDVSAQLKVWRHNSLTDESDNQSNLRYCLGRFFEFFLSKANHVLWHVLSLTR